MDNNYSRPQVLECPACGATLALPQADIFECDYCGKRIIVPKEMRPHQGNSDAELSRRLGIDTAAPGWQPATPADAISIDLQRRRKKLALILSISFLVIFIGLVSFVLAIIPISKSSYSYQAVDETFGTTPLPTLVQFARLSLIFGSLGDLPGQFSDPRSITVDTDGNIFVADYSTGKINKFDPQGNPQLLIQMPIPDDSNHMYIFNIDTDDAGNLYVAANGSIYVYAVASGKLLMTIPDQWPDIYYESVVVAPNGNLYSTNGMAGADELLILSPQGELIDRWTQVIGRVNNDDPAIDLSIAVNHADMVYVLSSFGSQVYGYNPDGSFSFNFGQEGDQAGQFNLSTEILAITPQDHLVIGNAYRVDLFDASGMYLVKTFTIDYELSEGSMRDVAVDDTGDLYFISSGGKVLKYSMNYP